MMLDLPCAEGKRGAALNPFVDSERLTAIIHLLRDDMEDKPEAYCQPLIDSEEKNEQQRRLVFSEGARQ
jgi:hypothetical protein